MAVGGVAGVRRNIQKESEFQGKWKNVALTTTTMWYIYQDKFQFGNMVDAWNYNGHRTDIANDAADWMG